MANSGSDLPRPGEFALIAELFAPLAIAPGAFGLTDDAAVITPPAGSDLIATADTVVEGVHFFTVDPPELIAKKALRVNLSDLAAKGCTPVGYLLTLSISKAANMAWLKAFASGLREDQAEFGVSLFGGDTTTTPGPIVISIIAFGHVAKGAMSMRSGARPGDRVYVSGTIGDAGAGLACLKGEATTLSSEAAEMLIGRYRLPQPRLKLGQALSGIASASIDVSDGLMADLGHIAETSQVRIEVDTERVPLGPSLHQLWPDARVRAIQAATSGDDYEIAFTAPFERDRDIMNAAMAAGTTVSQIGRVITGKGIALLEAGRELSVQRKGYTHF